MADTHVSGRANPCACRRGPALVALAACAALAGPLLWTIRPVLVWNASPSTAPGLYLVTGAAALRRGEVAIAWPPPPARRLASARHYLPAGVPLVKRVAAVSGDRVCAAAGGIFVNRRFAAARRARDPSGRAMPWWTGCRILGRGELFLLSPGVPDAFDGRYFGMTGASEVVGRARLLWSR